MAGVTITPERQARFAFTELIFTSSLGRSWRFRSTFEIASATSWPDVTFPNAVYCRSRCGVSATQMKNWLPAESGSEDRAMPSVPFLKLASLNSAFTRQPGPPVPLPCGQPVWIMNPGITRWKRSPS